MRSLLLILIATAGIQSSGLSQGHQCEEDLFPLRSPNKMYGFVNIFGEWRVQPIYTQVFPFNGKTAIVLKKGKYGAVSCESKVVLRLEYEEIKPFKGGVAWVKKQGKWGLATDEGQMLLEPVYDEVQEISKYTMNAYVRLNDLWGIYAPLEKRFIHELQFEEFQLLNNDYSLVKRGNKLGIARNDVSDFAITPKWDKVRKVAPYLMSFQENGKWGVVRDNGEIRLDPIYDSISLKYKFRLLVGQEGKFGMTDFSGNILAPIIFEEISDFMGGGARVLRNGKYGFISVSGKKVIPLEYDYATNFESGECVVMKSGKWGVINAKNKFVIPNAYLAINKKMNSDFYSIHVSTDGWQIFKKGGELSLIDTLQEVCYEDDILEVRIKKNGKWALYDTSQDKWRFAPTYDSIFTKSEGLYLVSMNNKYGVISAEGKVEIPLVYDYVEFDRIGLSQVFIVSKDKKGVLKLGGIELLPLDFMQIVIDDLAIRTKKGADQYDLYSHQGVRLTESSYEVMKLEPKGVYPIVVGEKDKWGLVDEKGRVLLTPSYRDVKYVGEGIWAGKEKKGWVLLTSKGKALEADPTLFENVGTCTERFIAVQQSGQWGFWDRQAKKFKIEPQYEQVSYFLSGYCAVKKNGKWGAVDKLNKVIVPLLYDQYALGETEMKFTSVSSQVKLPLD